MSGPRPRTLAERFWKKVKTGDGCWIWRGCRVRNGYGRILLGEGRVFYAHRASWTLHFGEVPAGLFVCHCCDNRSCVRPDHLFLGTHEDNMRDMVAKDRGRRVPPVLSRAPVKSPATCGERNPHAKLTADKVREIRALLASGVRLAAIAARFEVSKMTVSDIRRNQTWRQELSA